MTKEFPYPHFIDEKNMVVWVFCESGWPTVLAKSHWERKYFPSGYKVRLTTIQFLNNLIEQSREA